MNKLDRIRRSNPQLFTTVPLVELAGEHRVLVENHHGVVVYEPFEIRVRVQYGYLLITGCKLRLVQMTKEKLVILGDIESICLQRCRS